MTGPTPRHALVFGASGLIGRNLVLALIEVGVRVGAVTRGAEAERRLLGWLRDHGITEPPDLLRADFDHPDLITDSAGHLDSVTEIYNCTGAYRFGMTVAEARRGNVGTGTAVVELAARARQLRRLVYVSGYRVGGQDPDAVPWSADRIRETYDRLGPYEASKIEADAAVRARARELAVPLTVVNPGVVIGHSRTGESDQHLGLATNVEDLWRGRLAALPGDDRTFVPIVPVDYLAQFMINVAAAEERETDYWLLDDATPPLPDLLAAVAEHHRVRAPRLRIPVSMIRKLPQRISRADPETLSFLAEDRYPTGPAEAHARRHGLIMPDTKAGLLNWSDFLVAHRFGAAPGGDRRLVELAGVRTFELGDQHAPRVVLPGLPVNADTWQRVIDRVPDARAVDLPGLGLSSAGSPADWSRWLAELLNRSPVTELVAHSIGGALALEALVGIDPARAPRLTLVAPFFLQPATARWRRLRPVVAGTLRSMNPGRLSGLLTGEPSSADRLGTVVDDLRRPGVALRVARLVALAGQSGWRHRLRDLLHRYPGEVRLVVGEYDPLEPASVPDMINSLTTITGAGHHPQLTHPAELAIAIAGTV